MKCVRFSRYLSLLAISVAVLWTTTLTAQESVQEKKNSAVVPESRPDRKGWMDRHEAMNARVKQGNVDVIFVGDSITQGWEGVGKKAWQKFYANRNAVNLGISGDRTQHVLWRLDNGNIDGISPKLAVVMIGTNNASANTPEEVAEGVKAIIDRLRTKLPATKVLLLGIFPRGENNENPLRQVNVKVNKVIAKLADDKTVFYLDLSPMFLAADGSLSKEIMPDLLHPSAKGYEIWAESIEPMVAKLTGEKPNAVLPVPLVAHWWLGRYNEMNARVKQGNVDLIFIGDSITHNWEKEGKEVWQRFYGRRNAVNLGIGGDTTQLVLWRLDHGNVDGISPKLAVILIGTNNRGGGNTSEEIAEGIKAVVEKTRAKLPDTKVLLLGMFPRGPDAKTPRRPQDAKVNEIISNLADGRMVFYLDIGPRFLAADGTIGKEIMPDYLHPAAKGYEIWAEAIETMVQTLMGEKENPSLPVPLETDRWLKRHEAINARVKQGNVDLIFIGDSITEGWEDKGKKFWDKFYGNRNAVNLGISRDRTQHVLWRLDHGNIDGISPKLAVVMIGTNNSSRSAPEQIPEGIKAIVEKLRAKLPETKVLLLGIFPCGPNKEFAERQTNAKANEIIAKLADDQKVFYLDIGRRFLAPDEMLSKDIMPDLLHLSPKGYDIWAEAIEPTVKELFGEKPTPPRSSSLRPRVRALDYQCVAGGISEAA